VRRHCTEEIEVAACKGEERGTGHGGKFDSNSNFKRIQIIFKFNQMSTAPKRTFQARKIEIKYGLEDLEKMNNFFHRNVSRFVMEIELKFQEPSMS
jgi:hypothetical protein